MKGDIPSYSIKYVFHVGLQNFVSPSFLASFLTQELNLKEETNLMMTKVTATCSVGVILSE